MAVRRGSSSSILAAAKLVAIGALSVASVQGHAIANRGHLRRGLQEATSTVDYIFAYKGTPLVDGQVDGEPLQNVDGADPPAAASSIVLETVNSVAEYELYFIAPDLTGATGFTLTFVGQLNGIAWEVDMYDFNSATPVWVPAGSLSGITADGWTTATMDLTADTSLFVTPRDGGQLEFKVRLSATGDETGFLDYADVVGLGSGPPTPTPAPTTAPPATSEPTAAPAPVTATPVAGATGRYLDPSAGTATASDVETQLATADSPATSDDTKAVGFTSTAEGVASYELYFDAPAINTVSVGTFTITFAAQLGTGGIAENWKVEMLDFANTWVVLGTLAGATAGTWTPVVWEIPTTDTPENFIGIDGTQREYLLRITTDGATRSETIFLDQAVISNGVPGPTPTPTTGAPTTATPAAPTAPTSGTPGIPEYVEVAAGLAIDSSQADGAGLVSAEGEGTAATSIACASDADGAAQYEIFTSLPDPVEGDLTISVTAKLGADGDASHWKVGLFNHDAAVSTWSDGVALIGLTAASYSKVDAVIPTSATTPPSQFVETGDQQMLVRLYTDGATGVESLTLDAVSITTGGVVSPTAAPTTAAPSVAPTNANNEVQVDLVPCILPNNEITRDGDTTGSAYLMNEFFKGFWTSTQVVQVVGSTTVLDLTVSPTYGKCSVVFVGFDPTAAQKAQLQAYSIDFKVRLVYFNVAETANDDEVMTRLGLQQNFIAPFTDAKAVKFTGSDPNSVLATDMISRLDMFDPDILFFRPITVTTLAAETTIKAQYANTNEEIIEGENSLANAAIAEYIGTGDLAGLEELHVFFDIAWFDMGSWGWAHFIAEWGTRGIFQGERRFYLGAVVDDLFLTTGQWVYDVQTANEGPLARLTGADLLKLQNFETALNTQYSSSVKTEHAFNGIGILDAVGSEWRKVEGESADIALLKKGEKPNPPEGITQQLFVDWLSLAFNPAEGVPGMAEDEAAGKFAGDDLLAQVRSDFDAFYWQSHTLTHLARDNLGANDCDIEDGGNARMAVLFGLFDSDNYNWRSMTSPGITGLFNNHCLLSGQNNLMKCYPGDNTYDGVQTEVSLVNLENQFHSLKTTVETNGLTGSQIVPRYATNVYFNCVTGDCLVQENEWIRRKTCSCAELDPSQDTGTCLTGEGTACPRGLESFNEQAEGVDGVGPLEKLFQTEEQTTTRYILSGRRDKYMFHQANVISTTWESAGDLAVDPVPTDNPSLLQYWYVRVLAKMAKFINTPVFPIETVKFDNLCNNFFDHENLDGSGAVITAKKDATGAIVDMTLAVTSDLGAPIPLTVPTAEANTILTGALVTADTEVAVYGADTTYLLAATTINLPDLSKPSVDELIAIPQAAASAAEVDAAQAEAEADAAVENPQQQPVVEEATTEQETVAAKDGKVAESLVIEVKDPEQ